MLTTIILQTILGVTSLSPIRDINLGISDPPPATTLDGDIHRSSYNNMTGSEIDVYEYLKELDSKPRDTFQQGVPMNEAHLYPENRHKWYGTTMLDPRDGKFHFISEVVVKDGQTLEGLAHEYNETFRHYIYPKFNDITWQWLYDQNKDVIGNKPGLIEPGMVLHYIQPDQSLE